MADTVDDGEEPDGAVDEEHGSGARRSSRRGRWRWIIAGVLLTPILLVALYLAVVLNWSYSKGERSGFVQKFSEKGWLCKTWEGQLAMMNLPGTMPEKFDFTVRNDSIAQAVLAAMKSGQRTSLTYEQHVGVPTSCFGDTEYWVTQVQTGGS